APVTVNFSFDSSLADVTKKIVISYSGSGQKNPFLEYGGHYAWSFGDTLMTGTSLIKPHELNYGECKLIIDVDSLSGSIAFYGIKAHMFRINLNAGVYTSKYDIVFTPQLDGDLSEWWVSTLPSMIGGSSVDTIPVKVYHPRLGQYHYFRVYRNGELIEETLGCGYTAEIAPSSAGGMTTVNIPAENLAEKLNVVEYDFTVSAREKDPAIFTFGMITFAEGADDANTRVFDSQTVTYYPRICDVPSPVKLTINVTNNNGMKAYKHTQGSVSLDGSEPDVPIHYMFYNELYWSSSDKTSGYMNNDGILTEDMVYDFALTVYKPELVKDQTAVLTVFCGETSADPFFTVVLHRNPVTGTFDGQLVLEGGNYTRDQLPAYFDVDFLYDEPEQDNLTTETGDAAAKYITDAEKWFLDVQEHMALDAESLAPVDTEEFLNMLSAVAPAGAAGEEILTTAQDVCDYQNIMAGYYASMTDQLKALIAADGFSQAIINDGYISPALFGDSESAITVYKEMDFEQDLLLE
ncbi:MAG: hypothetical protein II965_00075, partial [Pyramidobacter sp.]|nr:hypothetical protein [Pyramidobacter sp.]